MPELDGLRGAAVVMVYAYHVAFIGASAPADSLPGMAYRWTRAGWTGVDLFFVLSGFLITGILEDAKGLPLREYLKGFYARRALRILPLYYAVLVLVSIALIGNGKISVGFFLLSLVYLSNVAMALGYPVAPALGILWSLAIEEQFYLLWPLAMRWLRRSQAIPLLLGALLAEPVLRGFAVEALHLREARLNVLTPLHLDGLLCGALLALWLREEPFSRRRLVQVAWGATLLGIGIFACGLPLGAVDRNAPVGASVQYLCASLLFTGVLSFLLLSRAGKGAATLPGRMLGYIGRRSYCIYLVHVFLIQSFDKVLTENGVQPLSFLGSTDVSYLGRLFLVTGATLLVSEVSYRWFESRILKLKLRYPCDPKGRKELQVPEPPGLSRAE